VQKQLLLQAKLLKMLSAGTVGLDY